MNSRVFTACTRASRGNFAPLHTGRPTHSSVGNGNGSLSFRKYVSKEPGTDETSEIPRPEKPRYQFQGPQNISRRDHNASLPKDAGPRPGPFALLTPPSEHRRPGPKGSRPRPSWTLGSRVKKPPQKKSSPQERKPRSSRQGPAPEPEGDAFCAGRVHVFAQFVDTIKGKNQHRLDKVRRHLRKRAASPALQVTRMDAAANEVYRAGLTYATCSVVALEVRTALAALRAQPGVRKGRRRQQEAEAAGEGEASPRALVLPRWDPAPARMHVRGKSKKQMHMEPSILRRFWRRRGVLVAEDQTPPACGGGAAEGQWPRVPFWKLPVDRDPRYRPYGMAVAMSLWMERSLAELYLNKHLTKARDIEHNLHVILRRRFNRDAREKEVEMGQSEWADLERKIFGPMLLRKRWRGMFLEE